MVDLLPRLGVAAPMPDQEAQTMFDPVLPSWILLLGAWRRILSDEGANIEAA